MLRGKWGGRRAPEWIRRMGEAEREGGRCGRMRVERVVGVVRRGWGMVRGRSGMEVVKRIMRFRGGMVGCGGEDEEAIWWCGGW